MRLCIAWLLMTAAAAAHAAQAEATDNESLRALAGRRTEANGARLRPRR